eukprot:TRINITY_DN13091_c0_g1_i1.p1 TRINITY_DN13091_c0_g1~~TRINITY_DN13091_c0_g1_i1.p1  ORF type:complete len:229 (+),score=15.64 TRINITY_DN13091_c0_g1_i1:17-703(+)
MNNSTTHTDDEPLTVPDLDPCNPAHRSKIVRHLDRFVWMRDYQRLDLYLKTFGTELLNTGCWTLLHAACEKNEMDMVTLLLSRGADPNVTGYNQLTPLHFAVNTQNVDMAQSLIVHGARIYIPLANDPYLLAMSNRKTKMIDLFHKSENLTQKICRSIGWNWSKLSKKQRSRLEQFLPQELLDLCLHFDKAKQACKSQRKFNEKRTYRTSTMKWLSLKFHSMLGQEVS